MIKKNQKKAILIKKKGTLNKKIHILCKKTNFYKKNEKIFEL